MMRCKCVTQLPWMGAGCLLVTGRPSLPFPSHLNLDLDSFMSESQARIGRVSKAVSQVNIPMLTSLVTPECVESLGRTVFQQLTPHQMSSMAVQPEDIFFQFLDQAVLQDGIMRIKVVSYSLAGLDQSRTNQDRLQVFSRDLQQKAARSQGILQKQDMDIREFRPDG